MYSEEIPDGEVHLWWASLEVSETEIDQLRSTLAPEELQRADRFRVPAAARRFIAARAALRLVLAKSTGVTPADLEFRFGQHGKPYLANGEFFFNASDSGDYVVVALIPYGEVGVDIEILRPLTRRERLARRICTDRELEALEQVPEHDRDAMLLRLWTCKEAGLKAIGTGLPGGVRNVEAVIPVNGPPKLTRLLDENDGWTLLFPDLVEDLLCTVVVRGPNWRAVSRPFSLHST